MPTSRNLLRQRAEGEEAKVEFVELFFDLVFVFAITQISHGLLAHLSPIGAIEAAMMLFAVWWAWIFTTWVTNWLDPRRNAVRLMVFVLMLLGLLMSTAIPTAFGDHGLIFALAYVAIQVGRSVFMIFALKGEDSGNRDNFKRITAWFAVSAVSWVAGGLAGETLRLVLWAAALMLEYAAPSLGFAFPGLGASKTSDWKVEGGHIAERCGLFVIIALGESILVSGATYTEAGSSPAAAIAFLSLILGTIAMWWIYFDIGSTRGSERIAHASDPGSIARAAYTYGHLPIVAGIILVAVSDELVLAHPLGGEDKASLAVALTIFGGPILYLLGNLLFKRIIFGHVALSHIAGLILLALATPLALILTPVGLANVTTALLLIIAIWETRSLKADVA